MEVGALAARSQNAGRPETLSGALADSERVLALSNIAKDPRRWGIPLASCTRGSCSRPGGELTRCLMLTASSTFECKPERSVSFWVGTLAVVLSALDRAEELAPALEEAFRFETRSQRPLALTPPATSRRRAEQLGDMGSRPDEAFVRLRAAEAIVEAGRRAEANVQLERALAFYRSVGATAYVREAEALFAASA